MDWLWKDKSNNSYINIFSLQMQVASRIGLCKTQCHYCLWREKFLSRDFRQRMQHPHQILWPLQGKCCEAFDFQKSEDEWMISLGHPPWQTIGKTKPSVFRMSLLLSVVCSKIWVVWCVYTLEVRKTTSVCPKAINALRSQQMNWSG